MNVEALSPPIKKARSPEYQRIAGELRDQIIEGKFAPGSRFPSTAELAVTCGSSVHTVHNALTALAREGWIERIHGAGTYVAEPNNRFTCGGIYHESDIGSTRHSHFVRSLHDSLLEQFAILEKTTEIFVDSRPMDKRATLLPALAEAIQHRRIQCLVAPTATFVESPALARLTLPVAFGGNVESPYRVSFDEDDFLREGIRCLARQGCRSAGLITHFPTSAEDAFNAAFLRIMREEGLEARPEWISNPPGHREDKETYGYLEFRRLWKLSEKPDGLIVYPDNSARGVITAVLTFGMHDVSSRMKFLFHRNAQTEMVCPFPVTWAIAHEDVLAKKLIQTIEKQLRGEKVSPTLWPYEFKADDGRQWQ
jgi:DNA-binding transcriptional regulator YhcF (GntR family)